MIKHDKSNRLVGCQCLTVKFGPDSTYLPAPGDPWGPLKKCPFHGNHLGLCSMTIPQNRVGLPIAPWLHQNMKDVLES